MRHGVISKGLVRHGVISKGLVGNGIIGKGLVGNGIVGKTLLLDIVGGMDMLSFSNIDESFVGARVVARGLRYGWQLGF